MFILQLLMLNLKPIYFQYMYWILKIFVFAFQLDFSTVNCNINLIISSLYNLANMAERDDFAYDFQQFEQNIANNRNACRAQLLGPWDNKGATSLAKTEQKNRVKNKQLGQTRSRQQNQPKKGDKLQFLATLHKQVEVKRLRFRTLIQRGQFSGQQPEAKYNQEVNQIQSPANIRKNPSYQQAAIIDKNDEAAFIQKSKDKRKLLNATMYVYQYCDQSPRKHSKKNRKQKGPFNSEQKRQLLFKKDQKQQKQLVSYGSKNLQRILKMKQKIRVKNHFVVKKIKQKQLRSNKQLALRQLQQCNTFRNWKSITLDTEKSHEIYEHKRLRPTYKSLRQTHQDVNLIRAKTTKFFIS